MTEELALTVTEQGGALSRISAAYRALRGDDAPQANPLGLYEPSEPVKAMPAPFPQSAGWGSVPTFTSWSEWDKYRRFFSANDTIDYGKEVGDVLTSSLILAAVRWVGNNLPDAGMRIVDGKGKEEKPVEGHELESLLESPNPHCSAFAFWKAFAASWITSGNAYQIKWRDGFGRVRQLWNEPHFSIRPRWYGDGQGNFFEREGDDRSAFISYYEIDRDSRQFRVEVSDVIHYKDGEDPSNRRLGMSPLYGLLRELYGDITAARYTARVARNFGTPPFAISPKQGDTVMPGDAETIKAGLLRAISGDNTGKPVVFERSFDVHEFSAKPHEMGVETQHRIPEERVAAVIGIPAIVLGFGAGLQRSTFSNTEQAHEYAYESYLMPLQKGNAAELTRQLLPDFDNRKGRRVAPDFSEVRALQEDENEKHKRVWGDYRNGIIDLYEARAELGKEAREEHRGIFFVQGKKGEEAPSGDVPTSQGRPNGEAELIA